MKLHQSLKEYKNSTYYSQNIKFQQNDTRISQLKITAKENASPFIAKCPQIKIHLKQEVVNKLKNDLSKSKKSRQGLLIGRSCNNGTFILQEVRYINSNQDEDIGACQVAQDLFCIGFFIQKQQSCDGFIKRLGSQLTKCLQKKLQVVFAKTTDEHKSNSELFNVIQMALLKHFRCFLTLQQKVNSFLNINKILFMPDIKFTIKQVHLNPLKFFQTVTYEKAMKFQKKYDYGYLSLSFTKQKEVRFLMIDRFDPGQNDQAKTETMIGLWVTVQKFNSKQQQKSYFWSIIMEYLRNTSLKKKSVNIPKTGIIFQIQKPRTSTGYIFQIPDQAKWLLNYQPQTINKKFPQQIIFSDQQVIFQQDKEESQIQSLANRSLVKNNSQDNNQGLYQYIGMGLPIPSQQYYQNNLCDMSLSKSSVDNRSVKSNQQKDLQISLLKKELEFYKNRCEILEKMVNSPSMMQLQLMSQMSQNSMMVQNHQMMPNNNIVYPYNGYNSNSNGNGNGNNSINQNVPYGNYNYQQQQSQNNFNSLPNPMNMSNNNNSNSTNSLNSFNPQNQNAKNSSSSSSSTCKILQDSQFREQEQQNKPPEPIAINKDIAFNKKKTFEYVDDEQYEYSSKIPQGSSVGKSLKSSLKKKESMQQTQQVLIKNKSRQDDYPYVNANVNVNKLQQLSPQRKHYVQCDYKNISFAQQNQLQDDSHYFQSKKQGLQEFDDINQSQIYGKSPQFKSIQPIQFKEDYRKFNYNNKDVIEFSFDSKDQSFGNAKNGMSMKGKGVSTFSSNVNSRKLQKQFLDQQKMKVTNKIPDTNEKDEEYVKNQRIMEKYQQKYGNNAKQKQKTIGNSIGQNQKQIIIKQKLMKRQIRVQHQVKGEYEIDVQIDDIKTIKFSQRERKIETLSPPESPQKLFKKIDKKTMDENITKTYDRNNNKQQKGSGSGSVQTTPKVNTLQQKQQQMLKRVNASTTSRIVTKSQSDSDDQQTKNILKRRKK